MCLIIQFGIPDSYKARDGDLENGQKAQNRFCPDSSVTNLLRGFLSRAPCKGAFLLNSSWNAHFQDRPVHNHRDVLLYLGLISKTAWPKQQSKLLAMSLN